MSLTAQAPFTGAEFYPAETAIAVPTADGERTVYRHGDAWLRNTVDGRELITPEQFRAEFPDGDIPQDDTEWEWLNNAWFEEALTSDEDDEVSFDLSDFGFQAA